MLRLAAKSGSIFRKAITINCRSLSSSSSSTCFPSPWLMLPPSAEEGSGRTYNFYSLAHNKELSFNCNNKRTTTKMRSSSYPDMDESELVGSSHGWIALYKPRNTDMFLFNPLTGRHIKLPPMDTIYTHPNQYTYAWVKKIIITCPPDSPPQGGGGYLCRAVMLYSGNRLAYCTPGSSTRWTGPINPHFESEGSSGFYQDFVFDPKCQLLLCFGNGGLEGWDITNSKDDESSRLVFENRAVFENRYWFNEHCSQQEASVYTKDGYYSISQFEHLVVHDGQMFLVFRDFVFTIYPDRVASDDDDDPYKTVGFRVHKIGREGFLGEREANSLGGLAMFVGRNHSFALRADHYPGIVPNSVYFTEHSSLNPRRTPVYSACGGHDVGVFDYESKTISPCYDPCDDKSFKREMHGPMWFTPTPEPTGI